MPVADPKQPKSVHRYGTLLDAYQRTLDRLDLPTDELSEERQEQLGRRAALVSVAEVAWEDHLGPLYDWKQVASVLRTISTRQGVNDLRQRKRLLGLPSKTGGVRYPAFQFHGGRPMPTMPEVLEIFDVGDVNRWTAASWFRTEQDELDGETPQDWLLSKRSVEPVLTAARRLVAGLAR